MHADMLKKHGNGIREKGRAALLRIYGFLLAAEQRLTDQLVPFPALALHRLGGRLPGELPPALAAFPPLDKIRARPVVPHVAIPGLLERYEAPAGRLPDFLDNP